MKHRGLLLIVAVGALVGAPLVAQAGGRGGMGGGRGGVFVRGPVGGVVVVQPPVRFAPVVPRVVVARPSVFPKPVDPWRFWGVQRPFIHKNFGHGKHFGNGPFFGAGVPFGYGGGYYYAAVPDTTYAAPPAVAAPSPSASMPTVVEYENGFYELRGDGVTVAYRWVWIPKVPAPPEPPPVVAPPAPPAQAPASPAARIAEERPRKPTPVYRWTNDQGVTTYT
ncbi:MAG TPA: hypothetical protein VID04_13565, partial [Methylomirabilota bacterium]